jgi:hypothetical protein
VHRDTLDVAITSYINLIVRTTHDATVRGVAITSHVNLIVRATYNAIVRGGALFDVKIVRDLQAKTVAHIHLRVRNKEKGLPALGSRQLAWAHHAKH